MTSNQRAWRRVVQTRSQVQTFYIDTSSISGSFLELPSTLALSFEVFPVLLRARCKSTYHVLGAISKFVQGCSGSNTVVIV